jgi:hypothetical protein
VGQTIFFASTFTWLMNSPGLVFATLAPPVPNKHQIAE